MPQVILRPMRLADIEEVIVLNRLGFSLPWARSTYRYEIAKNDRSTMLVMENAAEQKPRSERQPNGWLQQLFGFKPAQESETGKLIGYAGFWQVLDEAHISTITVHPDWRGKNLGELMLWKMITLAIEQDANKVTLEVRVSNAVAKALYFKYGFEIVGIRHRYYRDNNENADIMMVEPLDDEYQARLKTFEADLLDRIALIDRFAQLTP
ncbi:MAG: ribosomal protein S18-alanine N-acetyltransferase [Chloroflexi bacterium]|nr:ribosomal protein S18-alanine N-acetyltransferase [Chloroflexota bacterium]